MEFKIMDKGSHKIQNISWDELKVLVGELRAYEIWSKLQLKPYLVFTVANNMITLKG